MQAYSYIDWIWAGVGVVWLVTALASKKTARREATGLRLVHIVIMTAALLLLFPSLLDSLPMGPLARRFVPGSPTIAGARLALTAAGCAFAIWARLLLGGNWSGDVTAKQDHQLIRKGPYNIVRHPIYSGFLLGLAGTALALGEWRGVAGLALAGIGWGTKLHMEEEFMLAQFGAACSGYRREVRALIPFVL